MPAQVVNAGTAGNSVPVSTLLTRPCRRLWVRCQATSPESINVRVRNVSVDDSIHGSSEHRVLAAGEEQIYDASIENKISGLFIWCSGGTGTYSYEATGT